MSEWTPETFAVVIARYEREIEELKAQNKALRESLPVVVEAFKDYFQGRAPAHRAVESAETGEEG